MNLTGSVSEAYGGFTRLPSFRRAAEPQKGTRSSIFGWTVTRVGQAQWKRSRVRQNGHRLRDGFVATRYVREGVLGQSRGDRGRGNRRRSRGRGRARLGGAIADKADGADDEFARSYRNSVGRDRFGTFARA